MSEPTIAPIPVSVSNETPIAVVVDDGLTGAERRQPHVQSQRIDPSVPARTTFQEDLTTASQRRINLIWERTQAAIAVMVAVATMCCGVYAMVYPTWSQVVPGMTTPMQIQTQIPTIISVAFGTVIGFYFSRTNHAAIGGVGPKAESEYVGR